MTNKLLIFDLDDTLFETKSIGKQSVQPIIENFEILLMEKFGQVLTNKIISEIWKYPFDIVAQKYKFDNYERTEFARLVNENEYEFNIKTFEDFNFIKKLELEKILVTTGFSKIQNAKINQLGIEKEFSEIYIDDILDAERIFKKGIFQRILAQRNISSEFVYIIGDNPNSELKAGHELGLNTIQVSKFGQTKSEYSDYLISDFNKLNEILN